MLLYLFFIIDLFVLFSCRNCRKMDLFVLLFVSLFCFVLFGSLFFFFLSLFFFFKSFTIPFILLCFVFVFCFVFIQ